LFAVDREALKIVTRWFASDFSCFHLASEIGPASTSNSRQNRDSSASSITLARFAGNSGGERARPTALDFAATEIAERQSWGEMILPPGPGGRVPSTRMIRNRNCFVCQSFVQPWRTSAPGSLGQLESALKNQPSPSSIRARRMSQPTSGCRCWARGESARGTIRARLA
jgi:hypothetical protein